MPEGEINWFSDVKGCGFIDTGDGKDLFVIGQGPHGPQAEKVVPRP